MKVMPKVTVVVPSYNQGQFLERTLTSIFAQPVPMEVYVMDGGSTDGSVDIIRRWEDKLTYWRSAPDSGQACAINEGVALGSAPYVCWLNSDDMYLAHGLKDLLDALEVQPQMPAAYGKCWHVDEVDKKVAPYISFPFNKRLLANYCYIAQPATLIRRDCWNEIGGLDESLNYAMDYDLWLRLFQKFGELAYISAFCAANRLHKDTKTHNGLKAHYAESIFAVKRVFGYVPIKWKLAFPIMKVVRFFASFRYRKNKE